MERLPRDGFSQSTLLYSSYSQKGPGNCQVDPSTVETVLFSKSNVSVTGHILARQCLAATTLVSSYKRPSEMGLASPSPLNQDKNLTR